MPIGVALRCVAAALAEAGIDEPLREARLLLMAGLDLDLTGFVRAGATPLGIASAHIAGMAARRAAREPLSRILGRKLFLGLDLAIGPPVLDPRPETELLVEAVQKRLAETGRTSHALQIVDLGTGSGAILVALLARLPAARGIGVDISEDALTLARANAGGHAVFPRASFVAGDLFAPLAGQFDAIVSNPPYIPSGDLAGLMPEVRLHDPRLALDGGADGLGFYRRIAAGARARLKPEGLLALEIGIGQGESVPALIREAGFDRIIVLDDPAGIPRVVLADGSIGARSG